jgi:arginyl-tRNA synthetase
LKFPDVVKESKDKISPQHLAFYLYELANDTNRFYEAVPILKDKNNERKIIRLALIETVASIFERGLNILGISVLSKI